MSDPSNVSKFTDAALASPQVRTNSRVLLPKHGKARPLKAHTWAHSAYDFPATKVGAQGSITMMYDPELGSKGLALAKQLLAVASTQFTHMESLFGIKGGPTTLIVAPVSGNNDGSGGAYHYGCDFTAGGVLYLDATFNSPDPLHLEVGLYVAELSESFMGAAGRGWGCGFSNGEGLSRFCAQVETPPGTLDGFITLPDWANAGFPDWVSKTENTDQNPISTGCAIGYIYWMRSKGFTAAQITQAGGATLADNYKTLTEKTTAYQDFVAAAKALPPITSDNPFS
jgi:hypothetical protein